MERRPCFALIVAGFLMVVGVGLLIFSGVVFAYPYMQSAYFESAECRSESTIDHGQRDCSCSDSSDWKAAGDTSEKDTWQSCSSNFPCKEVTVAFRPRDVSMYHTSKLFVHYRSDFSTYQCSIVRCHRYSRINSDSVEKFVAKYGNGMARFECFYNPDNWDQVILERTNPLGVTLGMTLPSLLIIICAAVIMAILLSQKYKRQRRAKESGIEMK